MTMGARLCRRQPEPDAAGVVWDLSMNSLYKGIRAVAGLEEPAPPLIILPSVGCSP